MYAMVTGELTADLAPLSWEQVPEGKPGRGEVLIDVVASGVNRADLLGRQGKHPPPPGGAPYLGMEVSGTIAELGDGVTGWAVGDEVCALLGSGGYAQRAVAPVAQVLPRPSDVDLVEAAALPEVACTAWSNLGMVAKVRTGDTVLVHGGGSGVGSMAVQLAVAAGARVAVTAGSPEKLARCAGLGAEILIDYRRQDFVAEIKAATQGDGVDAILDLVGAAYLERNLSVLAHNGTLMLLSLSSGATAEIDLRRVLRRSATVFGSSLSLRRPRDRAAIVASVRDHVWPMLAAGTVQPVIDRLVDIRDVDAAHERLAASRHFGKIVLVNHHTEAV